MGFTYTLWIIAWLTCWQYVGAARMRGECYPGNHLLGLMILGCEIRASVENTISLLAKL
jgi:hypothetical protein